MPTCLQKEVTKNGFPSIAELAYKKAWAPLQNLCRRRVVMSDESKKAYEGKTALQWTISRKNVY